MANRSAEELLNNEIQEKAKELSNISEWANNKYNDGSKNKIKFGSYGLSIMLIIKKQCKLLSDKLLKLKE